MNPTDPRTQAALDAATQQIRTTASAVADRMSDLLGTMALSATRIPERDLMLAAQFELRRNMAAFQLAFRDSLRASVDKEVAPRAEGRRPPAATDWASLTLVENAEVEQRMHAERIGQLIAQECEWEQREVAAHMGALLRTGRADEERSPLRPKVVGEALQQAIEAVTREEPTRRVLVRELGPALAKAMKTCYADIARDLHARGVKPVALSLRGGDGPGFHLPGVSSAYGKLSPSQRDALPSGAGELDAPPGHGDVTPGHDSAMPSTHAPSSYRSGPGRAGPGSTSADSTVARGRTTWASGGAGFGHSGGSGAAGSTFHGASQRAGFPPDPQAAAHQSDAQLMALLRRLNALASSPGEFDAAPTRRAHASSSRPVSAYAGHDSAMPPPHGHGEGMSPLMAVNLIRAHRDELMQASTGRLDHMVIDVVGSLFDQILSDPRVPPQMARQIARLQLPVLRVALNDASFFSSRRHPVRRFVNRIASLACAFDEFDEGPGKSFLERVRQLVQEIVEGDFDQIDVYTHQLAELEAFIGEQTQGEVEKSPAGVTLETKESELRIHQRYMQQLAAALKPLALPSYLGDFLAQVWSQAMVVAVRAGGPAGEQYTRYKRAGRDLVMSVQPKGSPALRKRFLMLLPQLMKDLNEGMALIGWPEAAKKGFFGQLVPAHAEALKAPPMSELDHNLMAKQLEVIFGAPVPGVEALSAADSVAELEPAVVEQRFSPEEAQQVGLVVESAVDWDANFNLDLGTPADPAAAQADAQGEDTAPLPIEAEIPLDSGSDAAEPTRGPQLMDHIRLGFAYQMLLKDEWQKVRLTYVSPGRSFFVFSRGRKLQETISMTARMLSRMCEAGRLRAVENAYLMERATQRARKQLAALKGPTAP